MTEDHTEIPNLFFPGKCYRIILYSSVGVILYNGYLEHNIMRMHYILKRQRSSH